MTSDERMPTPDEFLFGNGARVEDYFIRRTPISEVICTIEDGQEYSLLISNQELFEGVRARLLELGVRIVERQFSSPGTRPG